MPNIRGHGQISSLVVDRDGNVNLAVLGRDNRTGEWASFTVPVLWSAWEAYNESAYDQREEQAQGKITDQ